ncbi:hypothetical protein ACPOLB_19405 [Rubrivivax sp. RP6-9]|uniref:hypothetical protein n=1 Tax=Rubrivivax sp. RP6-9 TaxID=3415750 RepID=UPI003CC6AAB5
MQSMRLRSRARAPLSLVVLLTMAALATGCSTPAPNYRPSLDNVEAIKAQAATVALGAFSVPAMAPGATAISLRGSSMVSPVGADYAAYLGDALRQELQLAGRLDPASQVVVSGVLLKNDIAAGGFSTNSGEIEARIAVHRASQLRHEKTYRAELSWESSFIGAIAIPKAQQQYPVLVQTLLRQMFSDTSFLEALK